jgi:hypothetical protein
MYGVGTDFEFKHYYVYLNIKLDFLRVIIW